MRLNIIVEGQTEETFVNKTLADHLGSYNIIAVARRIMTSKSKAQIFRGGMTNYEQVRSDVTRWCRQEKSADVGFTTMFNYYALPNDFPGYTEAKKSHDPYKRIQIIENAFQKDIDDSRFVPYIQLHEFEALLFTDIQQLEWEFIDDEQSIKSLIKKTVSFTNPELINDKQDTAPSKRIIAVIPEFDGRKASAGPLVADKIGIINLRHKCPHFHEWITLLEQLGN